jgi:hypothetical protein
MNINGAINIGGIRELYLLFSYGMVDELNTVSDFDAYYRGTEMFVWTSGQGGKASVSSSEEYTEQGTHYTHNLMLTLPKAEQATIVQLNTIKPFPMVAVIVDANGNYSVIGNMDSSLRMLNSKHQSGERASDFNHRQVTWTVRSPKDVYYLEP